MLFDKDEVLDKLDYKELKKLKYEYQRQRDLCVGWLYRDILNDDVTKIDLKLRQLEKSMKWSTIVKLSEEAYSEFNSKSNELSINNK